MNNKVPEPRIHRRASGVVDAVAAAHQLSSADPAFKRLMWRIALWALRPNIHALYWPLEELIMRKEL